MQLAIETIPAKAVSIIDLSECISLTLPSLYHCILDVTENKNLKNHRLAGHKYVLESQITNVTGTQIFYMLFHETGSTLLRDLNWL